MRGKIDTDIGRLKTLTISIRFSQPVTQNDLHVDMTVLFERML